MADKERSGGNSGASADNCARLVMFGLWAIQFDDKQDKLLAFTPNMGSEHTFEVALWESPGNVPKKDKIDFAAGLQGGVASDAAQTWSLDDLRRGLEGTDSGILINASTVALDSSDCMIFDLGRPVGMFPLVRVKTVEQFESGGDIQDTSLVRAKPWYPGVWAFVYDQPAIRFRTESGLDYTADHQHPLELHTRPTMDMDAAAAALHARDAYAVLMNCFRHDGKSLAVRFKPISPNINNDYVGQSGIDEHEIDETVARHFKDAGRQPPGHENLMNKPANCAGGSGTVYLKF